MNVLLATATVDTGETPVVTLKDPAERLLHYVAATMLWTERGPFDAIVLVENSGKGSRLADLRALVEPKMDFEFLEFPGNDGAWKFGKGYGEGVTLAHAAARSTLLREATTIWKVTGRLFVENALELVNRHRADENVLDPHDTRFYKFGKKFFTDTMLDLYRQVNDHQGSSIEVVYERALVPFRRKSRVIPFAAPKTYVGQDGGSGNWHRLFPVETMDAARRWLGGAVPV